MRTSLQVSLCLLFAGVYFAGCEDEPVKRDYPRVKTLEVTNITSEGALFTAEVYEPGSGEITEHGFVWAMSRPGLEYDNRIFLGTMSGTGQFTAEIRSTLSEGITYLMTAFVRSGEYTVYGNTVEFTSLGSSGPVITGFEPSTVDCGDTVVVRGRNFSYVSNKTFIDDKPTYNSTLSDSVLKIVVPYSLTKIENIISVEVVGNRSHYTAEKLRVNIPEIASISPLQAYWGDTIVLELLNLRSDKLLSVAMGSFDLTPVEPYDGSRLRIIVPATLASTETPILINIPDRTIVSSTPFSLLPLVIDSISPSVGVWSSVITLYGKFNTLRQDAAVKFGAYASTIGYISRDTITVTVPNNLNVTPADVVYSYKTLASEAVPFILKPPEILSVTPLSGSAGTPIRIKCKNVRTSFLSVRLDGIEIGYDIVSGPTYEDMTIETKVKGNMTGPALLSLTVCGQSDTLEQPFMVLNPYVVSFSPQTAVPGDTITIVAENFVDPYCSFLVGAQMPVVGRNGNIFKSIFPDWSHTTGPVSSKRYYNGITSVIPSEDNLVQLQPEISSVTPVTARYQDEVTVRGSNFSLVKTFNHLSVNGRGVEIISCSRDELKFRMPLLPSGSCEIELQVGGYKVTDGQQITCLSAWDRLPDLPFNNRVSFVMDFNGDVIVAASSEYQSIVIDRSLYSFNPVTKRFNPLGSKISCYTTYFGLVVKGDKAYISRNNGALPPVLDVFDRNTLTLSKVSDLPESGGYSYWLMDGDSILLAGLGTSHWKYNTTSEKWTRLNSLPGQTNQGHVFTIDGRHFIITPQSRLFEYNATEDRWIQKSWPSFTWFFGEHSETVVCNNKAYVCFGNVGSVQIAAYDPLTDTWERVNDIAFPVPRDNVLAFSLGEKVFMGGGNNYLDFWSFNTSWE